MLGFRTVASGGANRRERRDEARAKRGVLPQAAGGAVLRAAPGLRTTPTADPGLRGVPLRPRLGGVISSILHPPPTFTPLRTPRILARTEPTGVPMTSAPPEPAAPTAPI